MNPVNYPVTVAWAMPNKWTFQIPPIAEFVRKYTDGARIIVDPFCGQSDIATHRNDIATGGVHAVDYLKSLLDNGMADSADVVLFDPPYSPRQISEAYKGAGLPVGMKDTQNASLYAEVKPLLAAICKPSGIALTFGWQSGAMGKGFGQTVEMLVVQHGSAHSDTICVAQRKAVVEPTKPSITQLALPV